MPNIDYVLMAKIPVHVLQFVGTVCSALSKLLRGKQEYGGLDWRTREEAIIFFEKAAIGTGATTEEERSDFICGNPNQLEARQAYFLVFLGWEQQGLSYLKLPKHAKVRILRNYIEHIQTYDAEAQRGLGTGTDEENWTMRSELVELCRILQWEIAYEFMRRVASIRGHGPLRSDYFQNESHRREQDDAS